jgi:hypothetical protein
MLHVGSGLCLLCWRSSCLLLVELIIAYIDRCGGVSVVIAFWWLCVVIYFLQVFSCNN